MTVIWDRSSVYDRHKWLQCRSRNVTRTTGSTKTNTPFALRKYPRLSAGRPRSGQSVNGSADLAIQPGKRSELNPGHAAVRTATAQVLFLVDFCTEYQPSNNPGYCLSLKEVLSWSWTRDIGIRGVVVRVSAHLC